MGSQVQVLKGEQKEALQKCEAFLVIMISMFCVYIIYSSKLNRFYIGTTDNFEIRLKQHNSAAYPDSFTCNGIPWTQYLLIENLASNQAYAIELHIKKMKSKKYIENLLIYPEIIQRLLQRYSF